MLPVARGRVRARSGRALRPAGLIAGAAVLALTLAACGGGSGDASASSSADEGTPQVGGTLNMLGVGDVDYLDPNITYYSAGNQVARMISRTAYAFPAEEGHTTEAYPDLATDDLSVSDDGLTATFTIVEGAMWDTSPARQVTAEDFIRGVKRTCNPAQPFGGLPDYVDLIVGLSDFCDGYAKVDGTSAAAMAKYQNANDIAGLTVGDDERTVVITLTHPATYLQDMLTMTAFTPAPAEYDAYVPASADLAQNTVSCGPYRITEYTATKSMSLERNTAWDGDTDPIRGAYVDNIVLNMTQNQESVQQQLETGTASADMQFDVATPASQVTELLAMEDPNLELGEGSSSNPYVIYNFKSPNNGSAMSDPVFRQALSYGINRDHLIQALGGPDVNPALTHVLPANIVGGEEDFDLYPYDADKAKELLAQGGYTDVTLKFLYRSATEASTKIFETIQQDLAEIGITVEGVPSPNADFYTKYLQVQDVAERGVWDLSLAGWAPDWYGNAALSFFSPLFDGETSFPPNGANYGYYSSDAVSKLIDEASVTTDEDTAASLWAQADEQVMKDAAFYPVTNGKWPTYAASQVHNTVYMTYMQNFDPLNVWLDPDTNGA